MGMGWGLEMGNRIEFGVDVEVNCMVWYGKVTMVGGGIARLFVSS
jgi:hypothetical protein